MPVPPRARPFRESPLCFSQARGPSRAAARGDHWRAVLGLLSGLRGCAGGCVFPQCFLVLLERLRLPRAPQRG